ncbi:MAG: hypothetical protein KDD64_16080 [Bdellovibrionales bacterium]|nr:hypothetical protein [Bdellovibrionales bacterium]
MSTKSLLLSLFLSGAVFSAGEALGQPNGIDLPGDGAERFEVSNLQQKSCDSILRGQITFTQLKSAVSGTWDENHDGEVEVCVSGEVVSEVGNIHPITISRSHVHLRGLPKSDGGRSLIKSENGPYSAVQVVPGAEQVSITGFDFDLRGGTYIGIFIDGSAEVKLLSHLHFSLFGHGSEGVFVSSPQGVAQPLSLIKAEEIEIDAYGWESRGMYIRSKVGEVTNLSVNLRGEAQYGLVTYSAGRVESLDGVSIVSHDGSSLAVGIWGAIRSINNVLLLVQDSPPESFSYSTGLYVYSEQVSNISSYFFGRGGTNFISPMVNFGHVQVENITFVSDSDLSSELFGLAALEVFVDEPGWYGVATVKNLSIANFGSFGLNPASLVLRGRVAANIEGFDIRNFDESDNGEIGAEGVGISLQPSWDDGPLPTVSSLRNGSIVAHQCFLDPFDVLPNAQSVDNVTCNGLSS